MKYYNVMVPVVELVVADSETEAVSLLAESLTACGFKIYDGDAPVRANAFESEEQ